MLLKDLYKEAKENYAEVKKVKDGEYRIRFKSIRDTSKWNTYSEAIKIKNSITDKITQVTVHGVVRKKNKIPTTYCRHCTKNRTLAFKRWIYALARAVTDRGAKGRIIKAQINLPKHLKPRLSKGVTYIVTKCYMCYKNCLQRKDKKLHKCAVCSDICKRALFGYRQQKKGFKSKKWHIENIGKFRERYSGKYKMAVKNSPITGELKMYTEHRYNWELHHKKEIPEDGVIHHKDMNKDNNHHSNLWLCTKEMHTEAHWSFNDSCKKLIRMGIMSFDIETGKYYLKSLT